MKLEGTSKQHLDFFIAKIKAKEPFGLVRPADGEFRVLCNETLTNCDNWTFKANGRLRHDLYTSLLIKMPNLYIGIPCDCCNVQMKESYEKSLLLDKTQRTYANIFCNANWKTFISFLRNLEDGFHLVTSGTKDTDLPIKDRLLIDSLLVNHWDSLCESETPRVMKWIGGKKNQLFCFSAGPLSKIWIPIAMRLFPENIYLDVGSTLDSFTKGETNRFYTRDDDPLSNLVCAFKDT
jgi:hypothetical protein